MADAARVSSHMIALPLWRFLQALILSEHKAIIEEWAHSYYPLYCYISPNYLAETDSTLSKEVFQLPPSIGGTFGELVAVVC